jgi:hypothetical protein
MKRTRETIQTEIGELQTKHEAIGEKIKTLETELDNLDESEEHITVPWNVFRGLAKKDLSLWTWLRIDDVYASRNDCGVEDCWYKRNSDRLDGIEIYALHGMEDIKICDVCWDNSCQSEVLPAEDALIEMDVCLDSYDEKMQAVFRKNEIKPECDEEPQENNSTVLPPD